MPHRSRRTLLAATAAAAVTTLALAACSSSSGGGSTAAPSGSAGASASSGGSGSGSGSKTTLTWFMWSGSNEEVNAWKHVGDLVTKKYPDISVDFQTTDFNNYWTKLTTQAASGQAPCVVGLQGQRAPQFGNLLVPLDDYMAKAGVKAADFVPSITKGLQVDGKQVALPYDVGPFMMFYNKDAFKAAGLKTPTMGWTQDEFLADAKALTKPPKYGFFAGSDIGAVMPWTLSRTGKAAVDDSGKLALDDDAWKQTAQWYTDLITKEHVAAQIPTANSASASANQFLAGNAYMTLDGPWDLINSRALAKFGVGIAPVPAGASGSRTWTDGSGFGVTKDCKTPDAAFKAVSVMTGPEAEAYLGDAGRAFPARIAQQGSWYSGNKVGDVKPVMDYSLKNSVPFRTTPTWQQVATAFSRYAVSAFNGQGSVADLLSQAQSQGGS